MQTFDPTFDQKLALVIGNLVIQCATLEHENAALRARLAQYEPVTNPTGETPGVPGPILNPTGDAPPGEALL